jgi:hypothetical protein
VRGSGHWSMVEVQVGPDFGAFLECKHVVPR